MYYLDCRGQFLAESGVEVSHEELLELVGASVKQDLSLIHIFVRK